ncbi:MAG: hypothetical protein WC538_04030 [Thermoanaerobaculia bacterium]
MKIEKPSTEDGRLNAGQERPDASRTSIFNFQFSIFNSRSFARDRLAIALLCALITLLFADVLLGRVLYLRDLTRYYHPTKKVFAAVVRSGAFPYWDPFHAAGQPMAANAQYEVFYPPQWLVLLPGFELGYTLHILLHLCVAGVGMYLMLRGFRFGLPAALFGAVTFAIGGPMLSLVNLLPSLFAWSWMPLVVLTARRLYARPTLRRFAIAALLVGLQDLLFDPTVVLETIAIVAGIGLVRVTRHPSVRRVAVAASLTAALALAGVAVAAVQVIPLLDHVGDSARARGLEARMLSFWSLAPARAIELFAPGMLGHDALESGRWWGRAWYPTEGAPFVLAFYAGALLPVLLLAGALGRPRRGFLWLAGGAAFFWLAAAGARGPFGALSEVPPFDMIRYPEKLAIAAMFLATIAAAATFDRLVRDESFRSCATRVAAGVFALSIALFGMTTTPLWPSLFESLFPGTGSSAALAAACRASAAGLMVRAGVASAITVLLSLGRRRVALASAIALTAADLSFQSFELCPRMPRSFLDPPELVSMTAPDRDAWRLFNVAEWNTSSPLARRHLSDLSTQMWVARNGLFPRLPANWGIRSAFDTDIDQTQLLPTVDLVDAMRRLHDRSPRFIELLSAMSNVRYVALFSADPTRTPDRGTDPSRLRPVDLVDLGSNPRYYVATTIDVASNVADFVDKVARLESAKGIAFVESNPFAPAPGTISAVDEHANGARIDLSAEGTTLLVAAVTAHKYWSATVDGVPAPIRRVNIAYQGIVVPAGAHVVELRYRNPLVAAGFAVTATALFGAFLGMRRRRTGTTIGK